MREYNIFLNKRPIEIDLTIVNLTLSDALRIRDGFAIGAYADVSATRQVEAELGFALGSGVPETYAWIQADVDAGIGIGSEANSSVRYVLGEVRCSLGVATDAGLTRGAVATIQTGIEIGADCADVYATKSLGEISDGFSVQASGVNSAAQVFASISDGIGLSSTYLEINDEELPPIRAGFAIVSGTSELSRGETIEIADGFGFETSSQPLTPGYAWEDMAFKIGIGCKPIEDNTPAG